MSERIVVFDGECGLCNGFVAWLVRHDPDGIHLITGGRSEAGREVVARAGLHESITEDSLVLWTGSRALVRSDAVIEILASLGFPWRTAVAGRAVPRTWRDRLYDVIADRRPRIDGDARCGVPPASLVDAWRRRLATIDDVEELRRRTVHQT